MAVPAPTRRTWTRATPSRPSRTATTEGLEALLLPGVESTLEGIRAKAVTFQGLRHPGRGFFVRSGAVGDDFCGSILCIEDPLQHPRVRCHRDRGPDRVTLRVR